MSAHDDYLDPDRYGLFEEDPDNSIVEQAFADYAGPYDLYRTTYKYTACGPSMGFTIQYESEPQDIEDLGHTVTKTLYCDDLRSLGTWEDMREHGILILAIGVSSIVEGVDWDVPYREVDVTVDSDDLAGGDPVDVLRRKFDAMVSEVDAEAHSIWCDTHGCDKCAEHWGGENEYGYITVWADCPECGGGGIVI